MRSDDEQVESGLFGEASEGIDGGAEARFDGDGDSRVEVLACGGDLCDSEFGVDFGQACGGVFVGTDEVVSGWDVVGLDEIDAIEVEACGEVHGAFEFDGGIFFAGAGDADAGDGALEFWLNDKDADGASAYDTVGDGADGASFWSAFAVASDDDEVGLERGGEADDFSAWMSQGDVEGGESAEVVGVGVALEFFASLLLDAGGEFGHCAGFGFGCGDDDVNSVKFGPEGLGERACEVYGPEAFEGEACGDEDAVDWRDVLRGHGRLRRAAGECCTRTGA